VNSSVPGPRITIRCPNCQKDGSARAELINRKVGCKHCSHVFRALPVDVDPSASPTLPAAAPPRESSRRRIAALEGEIRKLREGLAARPAPVATDPAEVDGLREQLDRADESARRAEALPADREPLRGRLAQAIDRATASLLEECACLGVPARGGALRDLVRHRELFGPDRDPRLDAAILDAATVVQELCQDEAGAKPKLGVTPDRLAALTRA